MDGLPFVTGAIWHQPRVVTVQMRARKRLRKDPPRSGRGGGKSSNDSARKVTSQTKVAERLNFLDDWVEGPVLDIIHASAAYSNLTEWKQIFTPRTPSEKANSVLSWPAVGVRNMTEQGREAVAIVLERLGEWSDDLEVPEGLLMALVKSLGEKPSGLDSERLSNSLRALWACARFNFYHEELLVSVARRAKSGGTLQRLTDWSLCAMLWSYGVLDSKDQFAEFKDTLESERVRRGLSDSDVSDVQSGYCDWHCNRARLDEMFNFTKQEMECQSEMFEKSII